MKIKKNGKVINLTESDLKRIVKRVLNEEAMADDNLAGVAVSSNAALPGNKSYQPGDRVEGTFMLKAPANSRNAEQSGGKWTKGKLLHVYSLDYQGKDVKFNDISKGKDIAGVVDKQGKLVYWKVPFQMTVTPEVSKLLNGSEQRVEVGKINFSANISGGVKPIVLSVFPSNTNVNQGASAGRD